MRICCAFLACSLLVGVPCLIYGQSGTVRSTKGIESKVTNPAKAGQQLPEPRRAGAAVIPASHTVPRTVSELQKSHPDQIESDLRAIAENLSAAGLMEESAEARMLLQRVREHHEKLLDVHKRAVSTAWEPKVSLSVKWFEISEDSQAIASLQELFPVTRRDGEPADGPLHGTLSGVLSVEQTVGLIELLTQRQAKVLSEQVGVLTNGRENVFIQGSAVDLSASQGAGKIIQVATTENGSGTSAIVEILRRPNTALEGTAIRASAEVHDESVIKVSVTAQLSNVAPLKSKGEIPKCQTRRIQSIMEMNDGQSLALLGLQATRSVAEVTRVPILGDIPGIGPRVFSSKKLRTEQPYLLCIMTPTIAQQSDDTPKVSGFGSAAFLPSRRTQSELDGNPPSDVQEFGSGIRPKGVK